MSYMGGAKAVVTRRKIFIPASLRRDRTSGTEQRARRAGEVSGHGVDQRLD